MDEKTDLRRFREVKAEDFFDKMYGIDNEMDEELFVDCFDHYKQTMNIKRGLNEIRLDKFRHKINNIKAAVIFASEDNDYFTKILKKNKIEINENTLENAKVTIQLYENKISKIENILTANNRNSIGGWDELLASLSSNVGFFIPFDVKFLYFINLIKTNNKKEDE